MLAAPQIPSRRLRFAVLAVIVLAALYLRAWGVGYGLPALNHPDEPNKVQIAQGMIRSGDPNPHYFKKGSLLIYATANGVSAVKFNVDLDGRVFRPCPTGR